VVTHDAKAAAIADRVMFLADGCIVNEFHSASAREILSAMEAVSQK
jgi:putative ABC transport system ATP-binding protein